MKYLFLIISMLPFLAFGQDTTTVQGGSRFNIVIDGNITIEEVVEVYESPMLYDIQWGTEGAHADSTYSLDLSFKSAADKVDFQLVCGTELAVQGGWLPQTTGRNGFVEHTFTLSCRDNIQIHFEASTSDKIYYISDQIPAFALQLTEAEEAWVDSVKKKNSSMSYLKITNDSLQWTSSGHDNAVFLLDHPSVPAEFWNNVSADGGNIRVYFWDGSTETAVAREVVNVDTVGKTGQIYFDSSNSLANTANEWRVYAESGATEPAAADPLGSHSVWSLKNSVHHLEADPSGAAPQFEDSTPNNNDGTALASTTPPTSTAGIAGNAVDLSDPTGRIEIANESNFDFTGGSFEINLWFKSNIDLNVGEGFLVLFSKFSTGGGYQLAWHNSGYFYFVAGGIICIDTNGAFSSITAGQWYNVTVQYNDGSGTKKIFVDGVDKTANASTATLAFNNFKFDIGARADIDQSGIDASFDEFHTQVSQRTPDEISTHYNNLSFPSTFWTVEYVTTSTTTALSGSVNSQLSLSGETKESATLNGQSLSESSLAGNLYESARLTGLTESGSLLSGDLSKRAALRGQISGLSEMQGSLVMNAVMSGQVSVESVLSGNVIIVDDGVLSLSGSIDAQTALSGNLSVLKQVRGIIESQTDLSGSVIQQASLSGDVLTVSATSAEAVVAQTLSGAAFVSSSLSGEMSRLGEAWVGRIDITNSPMHTIRFQIKPMHNINIQVKS